jgi:hypothetical protein
VVSVRSALFAVALLVASVAIGPSARAESDGVPFLDGNWTGKVKGIYYDQTNGGSNDPRQRYRDRVSVEIFQDNGEGDYDMEITFDDGLPTSSTTTLTFVELDGYVGNFHASLISEPAAVPAFVGSGKVTRNGKRLKMKVFVATEDYTVELDLKLKKQND